MTVGVPATGVYGETHGDSHSVEAQIKELEKMLAIEIKCKVGAENLIRLYNGNAGNNGHSSGSGEYKSKKGSSSKSDKKSKIEAEAKLMESKNRINALKMEILKLKTFGDNSKNSGSGAATQGGHANEFCFLTAAQKIALIEHKINVEIMVLDGAVKILKLQQENQGSSGSSGKKGSTRALLGKAGLNKSLKESYRRVDLLNFALEKYQAEIASSCPSSPEGLEREHQNFQVKTVALTGNLHIKVIKCTDLLDVLGDGKLEPYVVLKLDNVEKAKAKGKQKCSSPQFNEKFSWAIEQSRELELSFYSAKEELCGVVYIQLEKLLDGKIRHIGMEIEPQGEVELELQYESPSRELVLKRNQNVPRQRVEKVNGHRFVPTTFYQLMKCAHCSEILLGSGKKGYQCQICNFTCHRKCFGDIMAPCTSAESPDIFRRVSYAQDATEHHSARVRHSIPHRFVPTMSIKPAFCCQCGSIVFGIRRQALKCEDCSLMCHKRCAKKVPDLCGISLSLAMELNLISSGESRRNSVEKGRSPKTSFSSMDSMASMDPVERKAGGGLVGDREFVETVPEEKDEETTLEPTNLGSAFSRMGINKKDPLSCFRFVAVLGRGNFGKVMLAENKADSKHYAVKIIRKHYVISQEELDSVRAEKHAFTVINENKHPFLVNLHCSFQSKDRLFYVMDYAAGGDLMMHIHSDVFTEGRARFYAAEVTLALKYLHDNGIVYRDLKLDNILLDAEGHIKVADFGLCKDKMWFGERTGTFCGTPEFIAPEILQENDYTRSVDWWALGVLIYEMLVGQPPYAGDEEEEIFLSILRDTVSYPKFLTTQSASIIQNLLCTDPVQRLGGGKEDAREVMNHPFFLPIDWKKLLKRQIKPPFVPRVDIEHGLINFDKEFTLEAPNLSPVGESPLTAAEQLEFQGFSFQNSWLQ